MDSSTAIRDRLIEAGIRELEQNGVQGFSLRRVAQSCGVSCAAPYKHFKDKRAFIEAIAETLNTEWFNRQEEALSKLGDDSGAQLRAVCKEYLRFLCENPNFCSLITQHDEATGKWHLNQLFNQSSRTKRLIVRYAAEHNMSDQDVYSSVCAIRAVLYGAAMMNQNDDMRPTDSTIDVLSRMIDSQFLIFENR